MTGVLSAYPLALQRAQTKQTEPTERSSLKIKTVLVVLDQGEGGSPSTYPINRWQPSLTTCELAATRLLGAPRDKVYRALRGARGVGAPYQLCCTSSPLNYLSVKVKRRKEKAQEEKGREEITT